MHVHVIRSVVTAASLAALALTPAVSSAQPGGAQASTEIATACPAAACTWLVFVNDVPVGSLKLETTSVGDGQPRLSAPFASNGELFAFLADCAACKSNSRPFVVPPGILEKLAKEHGLGARAGQSSDGNDQGLDEQGESGLPIASATPRESPATGAAAGTAGTAGTAAVIATPEPATLALVLTGLLGLTPIVIRARGRART